MAKKTKADPKAPKVKKLMMTTQELETLQAVHSVDGIIDVLKEAINFSLIIKRQSIKQRLSIENQIPGHSRNVNFDIESGEVVITDFPDETPKAEEKVVEAKKSN